MEERLTILLLAGTDTIVIRKQDKSSVFITTPDSIIISRDSLILLLNFLMKRNILDIKVIEGLLEEAHTG
jgi:hypothetical protein